MMGYVGLRPDAAADLQPVHIRQIGVRAGPDRPCGISCNADLPVRVSSAMYRCRLSPRGAVPLRWHRRSPRVRTRSTPNRPSGTSWLTPT